GQYIRAIIEGWNLPKQPPDLRLRNVLEKWSKSIGPFELHRRLTIIDPEAAGKIDPRNLRRTVRALEVIFRTGKRFAEQRQRVASNYSVLMVGLRRPRAELYRRIDERIDQMIADGLVGEVQTYLLAVTVRICQRFRRLDTARSSNIYRVNTRLKKRFQK
ncbi:MAG: tRNA dimethylallyltransferase, partial [Anaerolineales bacterium]